MWLDLAAAQGLESAKRAHDQLAAKMSPEEFDKARRMARDWQPTK
jgi:hypothetical protein